ncbi:MAG: DUF485 domain-containing protein [Xanthomonadales bacterium]|jgi:uncharacterized membrane protein (DUF485 family)|nr:DUF485 domain-containing protein [Xanthomonadales bacterium]
MALSATLPNPATASAAPPAAKPSSVPRAATPDWSAIARDPRFVDLATRKNRFLFGLMAISIVYYFLLPIGAAYFPDLFKAKLWGPLNFGLVFAFSEFLVAWGIAFIYTRRANDEFDRLSAEIRNDVMERLS